MYKKKQKNVTPQDPEEYGDCYTLTALKADTRLILGHVEGDRSKEHAIKLLRQVKDCQATASANPLVASDSWQPFELAIREVYGVRQQYVDGQSPHDATSSLALPSDLHYVQVRKVRVQGRTIRVETRIVLGDPLEVQIRLRTIGTGTVQTAYVERFNLTIRHCLARFIRKSLNHSKRRRMHQAVLDFFQAWYNVIKPHESLRLLLTQTTKTWLLCTPAMAEGLTDHVWTFEELARFRVPIH